MTNSGNGAGINLENLEAPQGREREPGQQPDHLEIDEVDEIDVSPSLSILPASAQLNNRYLWVPRLPTLASSVPTLGGSIVEYCRDLTPSPISSHESMILFSIDVKVLFFPL